MMDVPAQRCGSANGREGVWRHEQPRQYAVPSGPLSSSTALDARVAAWKAEPRTSRGGQPSYSALAIATALTLRAVFRLALRQTEGLIGSVLRLLGLDLPVPDHSTLSRRAETLAVPRPRCGQIGRASCRERV